MATATNNQTVDQAAAMTPASIAHMFDNYGMHAIAAEIVKLNQTTNQKARN